MTALHSITFRQNFANKTPDSNLEAIANPQLPVNKTIKKTPTTYARASILKTKRLRHTTFEAADVEQVVTKALRRLMHEDMLSVALRAINAEFNLPIFAIDGNEGARKNLDFKVANWEPKKANLLVFMFWPLSQEGEEVIGESLIHEQGGVIKYSIRLVVEWLLGSNMRESLLNCRDLTAAQRGDVQKTKLAFSHCASDGLFHVAHRARAAAEQNGVSQDVRIELHAANSYLVGGSEHARGAGIVMNRLGKKYVDAEIERVISQTKEKFRVR